MASTKAVKKKATKKKPRYGSKKKKSNVKNVENISFLRQFDIFNPHEFAEPITIVGCGGIGSSLAVTLAKMGIQNLNLIDDDRVEVHNVPNQTYFPDDVGKFKVDALGAHIQKLGAEPNVYPSLLEENEEVLASGVVCSGLDSMPARYNLWNILKNRKESAYFDGRLGGQKVLLYGVDLKDKVFKEAYEETLHPEDESEPLPCTERIIIDVSFLVSAVIARSLRVYLKESKIEFAQFIDWEELTINRIPSASDYIKSMGKRS